jgi:hypothetical protein
VRARTIILALIVITGVLLTACAAPRKPVAVPEFPPPAPAVTASRAAGPTILDCDGLLSADEATVLLGLPIDGVAVTSIQGVPAPAVGRVERLGCTYSAIVPSWPVRGEVLAVTVGRFADADAARAQSDRNSVDVAGNASVPVALGTATARIAPLAGTTQLLVAYRQFTLDLTLPDSAAGRRGPEAVLVDLARRILARLSAPTP